MSVLAVDGAGFADPAEVTIDRSIPTDGLWAVPGLVDAHAHLGASTVGTQRTTTDDEALVAAGENAWAQLAGGVFLVFEKGSRNRSLLRLAARPPDRRPELSMAGPIIAPQGGYYPDFSAEVSTDGLQAAVAEAAEGAGWVKLVGDWPRPGQGAVINYDESALRAAVDVAHGAGCKVAIHTNAPGTPGMAVRAGVDSIEHGLFLTGDDLAELGARRGAWVPTIAAMEGVRDMLGTQSSGGRLFAAGLDNVRQLLDGARSLGVTVLAGSDLHLPHGGIAGEALRMVEYGMPEADAIWALTTAGREYLGLGEAWMSGRPANAVFYGQNPTEDPAVLGHPAGILYRGTWLKPLA